MVVHVFLLLAVRRLMFSLLLQIVSHSSFLHFMLTNFGHHDSTMVQGELHKWFENCELRSVVLVDHGALQSRQDPYHYAGYPATVKEGPEV